MGIIKTFRMAALTIVPIFVLLFNSHAYADIYAATGAGYVSRIDATTLTEISRFYQDFTVDTLAFDSNGRLFVSGGALVQIDPITGQRIGATGSVSHLVHSIDFSPTPVPEPSTMLLLGGGLAGLAFYRKRKSVK